MARKFQYSLDRRVINRIIVFLLRIGLAPSIYYLLTVKGRKTGKPHSIPIVLIENGTKRWLVAAYGEVDWVKNARASGRVVLTRNRDSEKLSIRELPLSEAAPILKRYLKAYSLTGPYFEAQAFDPPDDFIEDARSKPVFELISLRK